MGTKPGWPSVLVGGVLMSGCQRPIDASELERPSECAREGAKACEAKCGHNDGAACLTASIAYRKNFSKMADLELRACELGDPQGCGFYANNFKKGEHEDLSLAREFSQRACDGGYLDACGWLVRDALRSEDRRKMGDPEAARQTWQLLCKHEPAACGGLADFERLGLGGSWDDQAAQQHYQTACDAGNSTACRNLKVDGPEVWLHPHNWEMLDIVSDPPPRLEFRNAMPGQEFDVRVGVCFRSNGYNPQRTEILEESSSPALDVTMRAVVGDWRARPREPYPTQYNACLSIRYHVRNDRHINVKFN